MERPEDPIPPRSWSSALRRNTSTLDEATGIDSSVSRRITFSPENAWYPPPRRTTTLDSTVAGTAGPRRLSYASPPYLTTGLATRSRQHGLDQPDSIQSPLPIFLDEVSSVSSDAEETDIEYDSDTASSILSKEEGNVTRKPEVASPLEPDARRRGNPHSIVASRFISYGEEGEDMTIEIKCGQDGDADEDGAIFRWIHLQEDIMDFERFIESSLQSLKLSGPEKRMVKQRLEAVRKQNETPFFAQYVTEGRNMDPFVFQELSLQPSPSRSHLDRTITILCFPFFLLEDHMKRVRLHSATSHPPLRLLQSLVPSTEPERDLRQVVCKSDVWHRRRCFYVGQLWGLLLDDGQIFTCARLPEKKICGDVVKITPIPTRGPPYSPFIKVTDGGNCTWQFRLEECSTWFDFTANFMEISSSVSDVVRRFEDIFRITMNGRTVESRDWERVVRRAKERTVHLVLIRRSQAERIIIVHNPADDDASSTADSDKLSPFPKDEPPPSPRFSHDTNEGLLNIGESKPGTSRTASRDFASTPEPALRRAGSISNEGDTVPRAGDIENESTRFSLQVEQPHDPFRALTCFPASRGTSKESVHNVQTHPNIQSSVSELLAGIHQKLTRNVQEHEQRAYQNCQLKTLPESTKYLLAVTHSEGQGYIQSLSTLETFFVAAVQVFDFFLPLENESEVAKRYWGAVLFIMKNVLMDDHLASSRATVNSMNAFKRLAHFANILQQELSKPQGPDIASPGLLTEFRKAWLHCILYLVLFRFKNHHIRERDRHLEKCEALLDRGRTRLCRASAKVPLHKKEVATPLALMTVIISNIIKDVSRDGDRLDIARIYQQYWKELEDHVKSGQMKTAQQDIASLRQEVKAVQKTLQDQSRTLKRLYDAVENQSVGWSLLNSHHLKHAPRPELPLLLDCIQHVGDRIKSFRVIEEGTVGLEHWMKEQIASTKHRHENAIYAFTIVTVVFLPLSFVCSFLGMNTTGIRDTEAGQWVFWASAIPLTFIVVLLALLGTDELGHAWETLQHVVGLGDKQAGFIPRHYRKAYRNARASERTNWKGIFSRKTSPEKPLATASRPAPPTRASTIDLWKPSRRTQTYMSTME